MAASPPIGVLMLLPFDPTGIGIGGIKTFAEGFIGRAPDDIRPIVVGATESPSLPLGEWTAITVGNREVDFLPIVRRDPNRRAVVPVTLRFAASLWRWRNRLSATPAVLQVHRPGTELGVLGSRPALRFIHNARRDLVSSGSESRWRRFPRLLAKVEEITLSRMSVIYAVGDDAADAYRANYPKLSERIKSITNWYDERLFRPVRDDTERLELRHQLGIGIDQETVLFVGRLEQQKNVLLLADAFTQLVAARPAARLVIVGNGDLRDAVIQRLAKAGVTSKVDMRGAVPRDEVARLMRVSDALCISSNFETGPTVGLEALASGLPVVTTRVGQVSRIVAANPSAGMVVAESNAQALGSAVVHVLSTLDRGRRRAAIEAAEPYSAAQVLAPVYEVHRTLGRTKAFAAGRY
jgi:glycosyltransferase involved in cell wall biosynthesis